MGDGLLDRSSCPPPLQNRHSLVKNRERIALGIGGVALWQENISNPFSETGHRNFTRPERALNSVLPEKKYRKLSFWTFTGSADSQAEEDGPDFHQGYMAMIPVWDSVTGIAFPGSRNQERCQTG